MAGRIQSYGYTENDYTTFLTDNGTKEYLLSIPMAIELCSLDRSEKGRALRRFLINSQRSTIQPEKAMYELTLEDLQADVLKACKKCKTPFQGDGELCQACPEL